MAMNLDAVLRIAAKVIGLEEVTRLEKSIVGLDKSAAAAKQGFKGVVDSSAWQGAAVAAAGIGVALGVSVKAAIDFESAMADVRKVVPGLDSAEGFKAMSQEILNMSKELPVSAKGLAEIMAAAGQAGIAKEELADFTRQAAQMGIAFDISAAEAGEAMAKLRTSLGLDQRQVVDLADAMNYLSNNMASSAAEVTQFMLRAGAMGKQVALTTEQTAAFGSAMIAAGAPPEVAATSFNNLIRALTKGESATARQSEAFQRLGLDVVDVAKSMQIDAVGTIRDVFLRISKMPAEMRVSTISEIFGDEARALTPLITNMALFEQAMGLVGDRSKYAGSMLAEFETRSATSANQFQILQNNLEALAIAIGNGLLPAINLVLKALTPVIGFISDMANRFPLLTAAITALVAAFAGLVLLAPFIVSFITLLGQLAGLKLGATIAGWAAAILPLKAAFAGFLAWASGTLIPGLLAIFSGPVGWTVLAVAAVVAMAIAFRKPLGDFASWLWNWGEPIRKFWIGLWDGTVKLARSAVESVKSVFVSMGAVIKGAFNGILRGIFNSINGAISNINVLINRANALSAKVRGPQLPTLPTLSVPQFAQGGVVSGPTLAMVGEGGEPEYIIPQSKMAKASMNYLNGARGGAVIPAFANGGFVGGNAQINVTTGPVMQQGGQQYVTLADLEKAMRKTADGVYASLRTPAGRYAVGVR